MAGEGGRGGGMIDMKGVRKSRREYRCHTEVFFFKKTIEGRIEGTEGREKERSVGMLLSASGEGQGDSHAQGSKECLKPDKKRVQRENDSGMLLLNSISSLRFVSKGSVERVHVKKRPTGNL